jgi:phage baseplate assembly protein W
MRNTRTTLLDAKDLDNLKSNFLRSAGFKSAPTLPNITIVNDRSQYRGTKLTGLTFPLKIRNGTLDISSNDDRVRQQILEVLQTSVGERVYRQFFGTPNLVFESISEDVNAAYIVQQLSRAITVPEISYDVRVQMLSEESLVINVTYQINNKAPQSVNYVVY